MFHDVDRVCQFQPFILFVAALLLQVSQFTNHGARLVFDDHLGLRAWARLPVDGPGIGKKKIREQAAELVLQPVEAGFVEEGAPQEQRLFRCVLLQCFR